MKPWAHGQIVPDGWAEHHRPIIAGFFCDTVVIRRKTGVTVDELGTETDVWADLTPPDGVPGLVQVKHAMSTDGAVDSAGPPIVVTDYDGRVDVDWMPDPGDRLVVVASPDPANLGTYVVRRRESQGHVVDRTVHLERVSPDSD